MQGHVKTQLIAHDKEVYDIAFSRAGGGRDMFASVGTYPVTYGMFTLDGTENDTKTKTDNDNYGFQSNMQNTSHCAETLSLMPLATFSHFIGLGTCIVLGVVSV